MNAKTETSAPVDVLAVLDKNSGSWDGHGTFVHNEDMRAARAAVAELYAERDRLANIVRDHEKQIIRMAAERVELVKASKRMAKMHELMMAKTNHGASFYDAECLHEMNGAPLELERALAKFGGSA